MRDHREHADLAIITFVRLFLKNKTRWVHELCEVFRTTNSTKHKEGQGSTYPANRMQRARASAWKNPQVPKAEDSHVPAQDTVCPLYVPRAQNSACSTVDGIRLTRLTRCSQRDFIWPVLHFQVKRSRLLGPRPGSCGTQIVCSSKRLGS